MDTQHSSIQQISFQTRVKNTITACAIDYDNYFVDYEYLIFSEAFVKRKYYIISAVDTNYLHLTGVKTSLSAKGFFEKCISSEDSLQESDFSIVGDIDTSLPKEKQRELKNQGKGNVRKKMQALPAIKDIFHSPRTLVEEDFSKNKVYCTMAAETGITTLGFITESKVKPYTVKPNTLMKDQKLSSKAKPIKLALRKRRGSSEFDEIIVGNKEVLRENIKVLEKMVSPDLLKE